MSVRSDFEFHMRSSSLYVLEPEKSVQANCTLINIRKVYNDTLQLETMTDNSCMHLEQSMSV